MKTRIMNRANLNPVTFSRYMTLCQQRQLLMQVSGGYTITPQAQELLQSINQVLSRATDLKLALDVLTQTARSGGYRLPRNEMSIRSFERVDLPELLSQLSVSENRPQLLRQR